MYRVITLRRLIEDCAFWSSNPARIRAFREVVPGWLDMPIDWLSEALIETKLRELNTRERREFAHVLRRVLEFASTYKDEDGKPPTVRIQAGRPDTRLS